MQTTRAAERLSIMTPAAETRLGRVFAGLFPLNIAIQAISFAAWVAFAHVLGASTNTDAYLLGLSVPTLLYGIVLTAIRVGAIPGLTEKATLSEAAEARAANQLVAGSFLASTALTLVVTAVSLVVAPLFLESDPHLLSRTRLTIVELSPLGVLGATTGVLSAILAVRRSFAPAVAVMAFDPLLRVCFLLAWGQSLGVQAVVLANLLGSALAVVVLWAMVRRSGVPLKLVRPSRTPFLISVVRVSAPLLISASVLLVNPVIDRTMAGGLKEGSITGLELGIRLVPTGLFVALLVAPLTATWSARKEQGGLPAVHGSMRRAFSVAAAVITPLVTLGIVLRHELVTLAYHGGAYSSEAVSQTSAVFGMSLLGLPAMVTSLIFSTLFIVQRETVVPMKIGFANVILNVGLNFLFRPWFGVAGIALSTSLTYGILNVVQATAARRRWGSFLAPSAGASLIRIAGSVIVATLVAGVLRQVLPTATSRVDALMVVVVAGGAGLLVYAAALLIVEGHGIAKGRSPFALLRSRLESRA